MVLAGLSNLCQPNRSESAGEAVEGIHKRHQPMYVAGPGEQGLAKIELLRTFTIAGSWILIAKRVAINSFSLHIHARLGQDINGKEGDH